MSSEEKKEKPLILKKAIVWGQSADAGVWIGSTL